TLDAAVELGVGLRECAALEVSAPEIEVPQPGIQYGVCVGQRLDRRACVAALQRDLTFDDLAEGMGLGWNLRGQSCGDRARPCELIGLDEDPRRHESDLHCAAVLERLADGCEGGTLLPAHEPRVGQRSELPGSPVGTLGLGLEVRRGAPIEQLC